MLVHFLRDKGAKGPSPGGCCSAGCDPFVAKKNGDDGDVMPIVLFFPVKIASDAIRDRVASVEQLSSAKHSEKLPVVAHYRYRRSREQPIGDVARPFRTCVGS